MTARHGRHTRFTLAGNKLIQTVEHTADTAYPVVADPSTVWGWSMCVAQVVAWGAANIVAAAKIIQGVRRFGSIRQAVYIAYRTYRAAMTPAQRRIALVTAIGAIALDWLAVGDIREKCFDS